MSYSPWGYTRVGHDLMTKYTRTHARTHASLMQALRSVAETGEGAEGRMELLSGNTPVTWRLDI